jgi:uncharacterized membrane protein YfhO
VLFKENFNPGWQAKIDGEKIKIYQAGLGFMYARIPEQKAREKLTVIFNYQGQTSLNFLFYLSLAIIILVIGYAVIGEKLKLGKRLKIEKARKGLAKWWEKDEEGS